VGRSGIVVERLAPAGRVRFGDEVWNATADQVLDPGTAVVKVRRFIAVDDCGTRINEMIIEGQVHGGLADGVGMALMEMIAFDEDGNWVTGGGRGGRGPAQ